MTITTFHLVLIRYSIHMQVQITIRPLFNMEWNAVGWGGGDVEVINVLHKTLQTTEIYVYPLFR